MTQFLSLSLFHETPMNAVIAEKVSNPYGSTAGAGSGDFHVYRHARAREAERWKQMNHEEREKALDEEFQRTLEANRLEEEQRTSRRKKKRQRQKDAKEKRKNLKKSGINLEDSLNSDVEDNDLTCTKIAKNENINSEETEGVLSQLKGKHMATEKNRCDDSSSTTSG